MIRSAVAKLLVLCAVLAPLSVASAQSMGNAQAQNEALLQPSDQATTHSALLLSPLPQHLLPHQYAEMPYTAKADFPELSIVKAFLNEPEEGIDLAKVELAIERLIDPTVNQVGTLHQLKLLADATKVRFPQGDSTDPELKGMLLLSTLRDAGVWNENRPFSYDLDDPLGKNVNSKLLSHFLATRKGNCVSMPVMFVVLGQMLSLPVTLSTAPRHDFAKFRKDDGSWTNIEVTSYGGQTDQHYIERTSISPTALANGIWLRTLTKKQSAMVIMHTLVEYYRQSGQAEKGLAATELFINADPKDVTSLATRGDFFCQLSGQRYKKYGKFGNIPEPLRADFKGLENNCALDHAKADELGHTRETPEQRAQYLEMVRQVKNSQGE
jgi:hypothetical protein